jgi:hypothetical protein
MEAEEHYCVRWKGEIWVRVKVRVRGSEGGEARAGKADFGGKL